MYVIIVLMTLQAYMTCLDGGRRFTAEEFAQRLIQGSLRVS